MSIGILFCKALPDDAHATEVWGPSGITLNVTDPMLNV